MAAVLSGHTEFGLLCSIIVRERLRKSFVGEVGGDKCALYRGKARALLRAAYGASAISKEPSPSLWDDVIVSGMKEYLARQPQHPGVTDPDPGAPKPSDGAPPAHNRPQPPDVDETMKRLLGEADKALQILIGEADEELKQKMKILSELIEKEEEACTQNIELLEKRLESQQESYDRHTGEYEEKLQRLLKEANDLRGTDKRKKEEARSEFLTAAREMERIREDLKKSLAASSPVQ